MKRLLVVLMLGVGLFGQETASRLVQMKNSIPEGSMVLLNVLAGKQVRWHIDPQTKMLAMSGPADLLNAMEAAVKQLDVPQPVGKNVELTFHMLLASGQADGGAVPTELNGVATQLRKVFGVKALQVLETVVLRGRPGTLQEVKGQVTHPSKPNLNAVYIIQVRGVSLSRGEKETSMRLDGLRFIFKTQAAPTNVFSESAIQTELDVREGQHVVVGKTNIDNANQPVFLVVTAKVVD